MAYSPNSLPNTRIDAADILRGIAVGGIILIHSLERFNLWIFPEQTPFNQALWDGTFFLLGSKMYAIFALLFGLSFFIQHDNQAQKGKDFRGRFAWRMLLLFCIGTINCCFYGGDILMIYAVCGCLILPLIRVSNKALIALTIFFFVQPIELIYIILALFNPEITPLQLNSGEHYGAICLALKDGNFWEACYANLQHGFIANVLWSIERGRMTQTIFLFLLGILLGRSRLFYNEGNHLRCWKKILLWSFIAFIPLCAAFFILPPYIKNPVFHTSVYVMLDMWKNCCMMGMIVSGITLLYYTTSFRKVLIKIAPYGKMSLTNYVGMSLIGGAIFYSWGLGLYRYCTNAQCLLIGVGIIALQYLFCRWWASKHTRGPLENLWRNGTWISI